MSNKPTPILAKPCPYCGGVDAVFEGSVGDGVRLSATCAECGRRHYPFVADHCADFLAGRWAPADDRLISVRGWILERDRARCRVPLPDGRPCLAPATEVDHIVPRSKDGWNVAGNLRAACGPCNRRKGARLDAEIAPASAPGYTWSDAAAQARRLKNATPAGRGFSPAGVASPH